ncbi:MAG: fasciclin domain-containing protein [Bacteroidales bacterium]|nr:fasciclin domain-containing protein [Bacteroidales bacterium]
MKRFLNFRSLVIAGIVSFAVVTTSCSKEEDAMIIEDAVSMQESGLKGAPASRPGSESIASIAISAGFSELVGALSYVDFELNTGLVDLFLNGKDQYTVFAPTNEAFMALYSALGVNGITDLDANLVLDVLFYHVTEGRRASNSVVPPKKDRKIETLLGQNFYVTSNGMIKAFGNEANIAAADISASNGIIHVIDAVILPDLSK